MTIASSKPHQYTMLYRGALRSCNYKCRYCSFNNVPVDTDTLDRDRKQLDRFAQWVEKQCDSGHKLSLFFIPHGEALIYPWYTRTAIRLSQHPNIEKIVFQTNLSTPPHWVEQCRSGSVALWTTYHPGQAWMQEFLDHCKILTDASVPFSVGTVGMKEHKDVISKLRESLPRETYLWINAFKGDPKYYTTRDIDFFESVDPLFFYNLKPHASHNYVCHTGTTVFSVDGLGNLKRCNFVSETLGNIYKQDIISLRTYHPCPVQTCHCHIGYVHLEPLKLYQTFGPGILERIPHPPITRSPS